MAVGKRDVLNVFYGFSRQVSHNRLKHWKACQKTIWITVAIMEVQFYENNITWFGTLRYKCKLLVVQIVRQWKKAVDNKGQRIVLTGKNWEWFAVN